MPDLSLDRQFEIAVAKDASSEAKRHTALSILKQPYCETENLPRWDSEKEAIDWLTYPAKTNPLYEVPQIKRLWLCPHCKGWHFLTKVRPPSGSSSGGGRGNK